MTDKKKNNKTVTADNSKEKIISPDIIADNMYNSTSNDKANLNQTEVKLSMTSDQLSQGASNEDVDKMSDNAEAIAKIENNEVDMSVIEDANIIPDITQSQVETTAQALSVEDDLLLAVNQSISQPVNVAVPIPPTLITGATDNNGKPKPKMSKNKKKLILIIVIISVLVLGIALAIALPLANFYKDKVMVNSADDFVYEVGKYFVLTKDINIDGDLDLSNMPCDIDFNKHILTVSGKIIINTDGAPILIFNDKHLKEPDPNKIKSHKEMENAPKVIKRGIINTNTLQINAPNAAITFGVNIICQNLNVTAKNIEIINNIENPNLTNTFINCPTVTLKGNNLPSISLINSQLIQPTGSIGDISLDNDSLAQIFGFAQSITGGKKVAVLGGVSSVKNVAILAIMNYISATNCGHIIIIDKLDYTKDVVVEKRLDNTFVAKVSPTYNAQKYGVIINNEVITNDTNEIDITNVLSTLTAGKYELSAYAVGNYNFETLSTTDSIVYYNGEKKIIEYTHKITLSTPQNLKIEPKDNKIILTFDKVNFANKYTIFHNGLEFESIKDKGQGTFSFDLTRAFSEVGTHSIKIIAHSKNNQIDDSLAAMISYDTFKTIDKVSNLSCQYENGKIYLSWSGIYDTKLFRVYVIKENGETVQLGFTSDVSYFTEYTTDNKNDKIFVVAEGHGYYKQGEATSTFVLPQTPAQP